MTTSRPADALRKAATGEPWPAPDEPKLDDEKLAGILRGEKIGCRIDLDIDLDQGYFARVM